MRAPTGAQATSGLRWLRASLLIGLSAAACGEDDPVVEPPIVVSSTGLWNVTDPCSAEQPTPSDALYEVDGRSALTACPLPGDPVEAALAPVTRELRAPADAVVKIPFQGTIDALTVSTATLAGTIPSVILVHRTGTGTSAASYAIVSASASLNGTTIELRKNGALLPGETYLAVVTQQVKDTEKPQKAPLRAPAVTALIGDAVIAAGTIEGLDAATATRLEAQRTALQPAFSALASRFALPKDKIVSIHAFTVEAGAMRLARLVGDYQARLAAGRFPAMGTSRSVPLTEIYAGQPPVAYENVLEFHVGTVKVPKVLDDNGRIRPTWLADGLTIDLPFSFSIPRNAPNYPVVVFVPGFGRGKLDGRGVANEFAGGPRTAVMTIELRCHGDRAPGADGICKDDRTPAEIDALVDTGNNGNPEFNGADGISDTSGVGFFPSDGLALRDTQLAATIEILHVLWAIRQPSLLSGITVNAARLHLIGHGHASTVVLAAAAHTDANTRNLTVQLPAGGVGYKSLILDGPAPAKSAFIASLPAGVGEGLAPAYLDRLSATALTAIDVAALGLVVGTRLRNGGRLERGLLAHPSSAASISMTARQALITALGLPANRISRHSPECPDFFIYTCRLGDNPTWRAEARRQMITFVDSGGVTVTPPGT